MDKLKNLLERLRHISARGIVQSIENIWQRFRDFLEKTQHTYYRFVVMNNDTFEEVGSYRLSLMNVYVLISSLLVGLTIFGIFLVIFTPLKNLVPGYKGYGNDRAIFDLTERIDSLERSMRAQESYNSNFRKMLTNGVETEKDFPRDTSQLLKDSLSDIPPSEAEMILRSGSGSGDFDTSTVANGSKSLSNIRRNERLESMFLIAPISGAINLGFQPDKKHYGVDIIAPKNTAVKAIADGFVISSDWTLETGNTIAIQHANNVVSFYKHNATLLKKTGDRVKSGEAIAIIGNTGEQTTGPHLHFELWKDGKPLNPAEYIRF